MAMNKRALFLTVDIALISLQKLKKMLQIIMPLGPFANNSNNDLSSGPNEMFCFSVIDCANVEFRALGKVPNGCSLC